LDRKEEVSRKKEVSQLCHNSPSEEKQQNPTLGKILCCNELLVPGTGIEPARYQVPADFESFKLGPESLVNTGVFRA
jgi:hypothetical protein